MFRDLTRIKQKLSDEECKAILTDEVRGVLSLTGDNGYPYGVPINYYYSPSENKIYFHSSKSGHKIDAVKMNDKASFCVYDKGFHKDGHWSLNIKSVIVFGRITVSESWSRDMIVAFCKKFTDDMDYIDKEIETYAANTVVLEMSVEHMTGKIINEA